MRRGFDSLLSPLCSADQTLSPFGTNVKKGNSACNSMVMWQDLVVSSANLVFIVSLTIQIMYGYKRKLALISEGTSIPIFIALYAMSLSFLTISLYLSSAMMFISGSSWVVLLVQSMIYKEVGAKK